MRRVIRLGDPTTHGGKVASAAGNYTIMGKNVARLGDVCTCPIPGHNNCTIVEGDPTHTIDGRPVAYEGHKTSCGATLISTCSQWGRSYEGDGAVAGFGFGADAAASPSVVLAQENIEQLNYDEHFILHDKRTSELLEDWDYRIEALGQTAEGTTDRSGKTGRVGSDAPEQVAIEYAYPTKIGV